MSVMVPIWRAPPVFGWPAAPAAVAEVPLVAAVPLAVDAAAVPLVAAAPLAVAAAVPLDPAAEAAPAEEVGAAAPELGCGLAGAHAAARPMPMSPPASASSRRRRMTCRAPPRISIA
jgi:hypothetical protein